MYRLMTSTPHLPSSRSSDASRCRQPSWKKTLTSWSSIVELHAGSTYFGELGSETKPDQFADVRSGVGVLRGRRRLLGAQLPGDLALDRRHVLLDMACARKLVRRGPERVRTVVGSRSKRVHSVVGSCSKRVRSGRRAGPH